MQEYIISLEPLGINCHSKIFFRKVTIADAHTSTTWPQVVSFHPHNWDHWRLWMLKHLPVFIKLLSLGVEFESQYFNYLW